MKTKNNRSVPIEQNVTAAAPQYCVVLEEVGDEKNPVINTVREVTGRNRAAEEKKAAKMEAQRNVVLELFRDKVMTEFQGIKAYLETELV